MHGLKFHENTVSPSGMGIWFIMEVGEVGVGVQTEVMGDQK